jgi:hypothetical protein
MLMPRLHNVEQIRNVKVANKSLENVAEYRYLGATVKKSKWNFTRK